MRGCENFEAEIRLAILEYRAFEATGKLSSRRANQSRQRNLPSSYKISPICNYGSTEMLFITIVLAIRKEAQTADRAVAE